MSQDESYSKKQQYRGNIDQRVYMANEDGETFSEESYDYLCPICLDVIGAREMSMRCVHNHYFHQCCLNDWIIHKEFDSSETGGGNTSNQPTCPLCRSTLNYKSARFSEYLNNPSYSLDERSFREKLRFNLVLFSSRLSIPNRKEIFSTTAPMFIFVLYKGILLHRWNLS